MKTVVSMDPEGRLTVPAAARAALNLKGAVEFEVEITQDTLIFHPVAGRLNADAWAYTPEHISRVKEARRQVRAGKTHKLTEADLERMKGD